MLIPMTKFFLVSLLFIFSKTTSAKVFCPRADVSAATQAAEVHSGFDKNKHCSVSCMLTLKCSHRTVLAIGYLKEIEDIFTPGDADWKDITADRLGISLARFGRARTKQECFEQCDNYFPPK